MKATWLLFVALTLSWPAVSVLAEPSPLAPEVGSVFEIRTSRSSQERSSRGDSGNSGGTDVIEERVIAVRADGLELEYDLPKQDSTGFKDWRFPVRVYRPQSGPLQILGQSEMEVRLERWLEAAKLTRSACGRSIFTWNAFRIECEPRSVIDTIMHVDLRSVEARAGAPYRAAGARNPVRLMAKAAGPDGLTFVADMDVDPELIRRQRAETDVVVGEVVGRPLTLEDALNKRAKEVVAGTISATFDTDQAGIVWRRTVVTKLSINGVDGQSETKISTETVERRLLSGR